MTLPKIKICCISSLLEAREAMEMGAAALGLVGPMPSGPGVISNSLIREIVRDIPPPIATFLLSSETTAPEIIAHYREVYSSTLQLVDAVTQREYLQLREALPGVKLVQVIHVIGEESVEEALQAAYYADALLLDSGNPNLGVKVLGGTGKTHNWQLSRKIAEQAAVPVFLAGGLHAGNVQDALDQVNPYGLDLCSGVRSHGLLDPAKLEAFFRAAGY